jgi:hypothetical protein
MEEEPITFFFMIMTELNNLVAITAITDLANLKRSELISAEEFSDCIDNFLTRYFGQGKTKLALEYVIELLKKHNRTPNFFL